MIRNEQPQDAEAIREIHVRAFDQPVEAELVETLRRNCDDLLSLVAIVENQVVGHILFSPATIEGADETLQGMGLAPMAVLPEFQRQGIGSELVRAGLKILERKQCPFVIVLGHAVYYPRFGFEPASRHGVRCEWEVPDEAFMLLALDKSIRPKLAGLAKYRPEFSEAV